MYISHFIPLNASWTISVRGDPVQELWFLVSSESTISQDGVHLNRITLSKPGKRFRLVTSPDKAIAQWGLFVFDDETGVVCFSMEFNPDDQYRMYMDIPQHFLIETEKSASQRTVLQKKRKQPTLSAYWS